jgi:hypothetical protein
MKRKSGKRKIEKRASKLKQSNTHRDPHKSSGPKYNKKPEHTLNRIDAAWTNQTNQGMKSWDHPKTTGFFTAMSILRKHMHYLKKNHPGVNSKWELFDFANPELTLKRKMMYGNLKRRGS